MTVKSVALVAVPPGVVTRMRPVVAPDGTVAVMRVDEDTENWVAATLLKLTLVAPVKLVPSIVDHGARAAASGEKLVIVGGGGVGALFDGDEGRNRGHAVESTTNNMYGPGGAAVPFAGAVTVRLLPLVA